MPQLPRGLTTLPLTQPYSTPCYVLSWYTQLTYTPNDRAYGKPYGLADLHDVITQLVILIATPLRDTLALQWECSYLTSPPTHYVINSNFNYTLTKIKALHAKLIIL